MCTVQYDFGGLRKMRLPACTYRPGNNVQKQQVQTLAEHRERLPQIRRGAYHAHTSPISRGYRILVLSPSNCQTIGQRAVVRLSGIMSLEEDPPPTPRPLLQLLLYCHDFSVSNKQSITVQMIHSICIIISMTIPVPCPLALAMP
jgi:hypothetical protein